MRVKMEFATKDYTKAEIFISSLGFGFRTTRSFAFTPYAEIRWSGPNITGVWDSNGGRVWLHIPDICI